MKNIKSWVATIAVASLLGVGIAYAQSTSETTVTVPYGDMIAAVVQNWGTFLTTVIVGVASRFLWLLPKVAQDAWATFKLEQLLARAVDYGINATAGAAKGQTLNVDVGSKVLKNAADQALLLGPRWLLRWVGGEENLKRMILARLDLESAASAQKVIG